ncbi:MAG TPA: ComEC/Rec2 family competence protein, partial [Gemmatimonadaceae bacterium]|nr:ComEC/Rec2 family competence protein [Gemmatimonadaceae bacterium]
MPLAAAALIAYAAGLLMGFGGAVVAGALLAGAGLAVAALRRDALLAACALLLAAGAAAAAGRAASDAACRERAAHATMWRLTMTEPARPGRLARARWREGGCTVAVSLVVEAGRAPAGAVVVARGAAVTSRRGLLVREAVLEPTGGRDALLSLRARAGEAIDRLFHGDAPLVRALLIADASQLDRGMRDRFADAGLVHMLSISGLHVAIIAAAAELVLRALRLSRAR